MAGKRLRKPKATSDRASISADASDWMRHFLARFEDNFIDSAPSIPADARVRDYQVATIREMFRTLLESGMDAESFAEAVGRVLIEKRPGPIEWDSELNQRRFELIDKEIQETLTPAESVELAGLTRIMREQLESEASQPMEGAKALHRKLLEQAARGKPP